MSQPVKGDYVLATKWSDGDPENHYVVGFYDCFRNGRHFVVDNEGNQFRANGFRRVAKISDARGRFILGHTTDIKYSGRSVWWWKRTSMPPPPTEGKEEG